jgi:hypothetical protein
MNESRISWSQLQSLLDRSYAGRLLDSFLEVYDVPALARMPLSALAQQVDAFEHIVEVFEQDLRLGVDQPGVGLCKKFPDKVLSCAIIIMLRRKYGADFSKRLAAKGLVWVEELVNAND